MGPKTVQNVIFQKWPRTLWEGQTDFSGPFWAHSDQLPMPGTGERILDIDRYTVFQSLKEAKSLMKHLIVSSSVQIKNLVGEA